MVPTCFISLFSLCIPVRSVLVAPVWPISWMEMAGLVAVDWRGRTNEQAQNNHSKEMCYITHSTACR